MASPDVDKVEDGSTPPRKILDLDVNEVSVVDRPAILRRFLVTKRITEDEPMGAFEIDKKVEELKKANPDMSDEEAKKQAEEAKVKAEAEAKAKELPSNAAVDSKVKPTAAKKDDPAEKAMPPELLASALDKLKGAPKEAISALKEYLAGKKGTKKSDDPPVEPVVKADPEPEPNLMVVKADGTIVLSQTELAKRKMFTSGRTKTLKETVLQLASMLGEVDKEAALEIAAAIKELPSNAVVDSQVRPVPAKKSDDADLKAQNEDLQKQVTDLTKRLDDIDKDRTPSKAVNEDGTDTKVEKKDNIWKGLPIT